MNSLGRNLNDEKRLLEKSKSLLNWLTQRNFDKIKDEIVQTIRASPSAFVLKSLVCCIFDMAMVENAYVLFARLSVVLFHELPPFRSYDSLGDITTYETLFFCKCRLELQESSPVADTPPMNQTVGDSLRPSGFWLKFSRIGWSLKQLGKVLMNPIFPPQRNIDAMNLFMCCIGKLADFQFCDENLKQLLQTSLAAELKSKHNDEVRRRKEAEEAVAGKKEEVEVMIQLLESYKDEQANLHLQAQALEQNHQEELQLRKETEYTLAIERERIDKLKLQLHNLENEHDDMRLKAEELESKYKGELILRKESETALEKERDELEEVKLQLEACIIEQENLTSQIRTCQEKHEEETSLRKEREDALSREQQELQIVKGILESYDQVAEAMREERDNALKKMEELTIKQMEERQPLQSFICPITQEVMKDPQIAADGFTYEAEAIKKWLSTGRDTSPMTNLKLSNRNLVPNRALRSAIQEFV